MSFLRSFRIPWTLLLLVSACGEGNSNKSPITLKSWEEPDEAMRIGRGVDQFAADGSAVRGDCFAIDPESYTEKTWRDIADGNASKLTERRVTSYDELLNELNVSVSASIRGTFGGGSGSFSKYQKYLATEENFTWLIKKEIERASVTLKLPNLPEEQLLSASAMDALKQGKDVFQKKCGTHFVRGMRLGGQLTYIQQIDAKASDYVRKIDAHLSGSGGSLSLSGKARADLTQLIQEAIRFNSYSRDLFAVGPQVDLQGLTMDKIDATLNEFEKGVTQDSAKPIAMDLAPWETLVKFPDDDPFLRQNRENRLKDLHTRFWQNAALLEKVDMYLSLNSQSEINLTEEEMTRLTTSRQELERERDDLTALGSSCYRDIQQCKGEIPAAVKVEFPEIQRNYDNWVAVEYKDWIFKSPVGIEAYRENSGILGVNLPFWQSLRIKSGKLIKLSWAFREIPCSPINFSRYQALNSKSNVYFHEDNFEDEGQLTNIYTLVPHNESCLMVDFYTENHPDSQYKLNENSEASQFILRILNSINHL